VSTHWQSGKIVPQWTASGFLRTEKRLKGIADNRDLSTLGAILNRTSIAYQKVALYHQPNARSESFEWLGTCQNREDNSIKILLALC
jgi:hypothetical protein